MRLFTLTAVILTLVPGASLHAGVLQEMQADGSLQQVSAPQFTDPAKAKAFAAKCRELAAELEPLSPLYRQAVMAGEFLQGRPYVLKTTKVPSVIRLRDELEIPAPDDIVYVRFYPSKDAMPDFVQAAFSRPETQGVTLAGRYIAIIHSLYPQANEDVLSHEMVHAFITLTSPKVLPKWFQEGAAVYFSTGKDTKFYGREAGVPKGVITTLPEDYKESLRIFNFYLGEEKVPRDKFRKFIRKAVETGTIDLKMVGYGTASEHPKPKPQVSKKLVTAIAAGFIIATIVIAVLVSRKRQEEW